MKRFSEEDRETIWDMREAGVPVKRIAKHLDRQNVSLRKFIADHGGKRPAARQRSELRLSLEEREEISRGLAAGLSIRAIAAGLERSPSTVCREVNAHGGARKYRALQADRGASRRALRPKRAKLSRCARLRKTVERKLEARWSPQQISAWLADTYPDDPEMQMSHETIYSVPLCAEPWCAEERTALVPADRSCDAARQGLPERWRRPRPAHEHGDDLGASGRRPRPSRARSLGGGPHLREEDDRHRHPR